MKATIPYVEATFARFNDLCFGGRLQLPPIRLSRARSFLGKVEFKRHRKLGGSYRYSDFVLVISSLLDLPETLVEDTILHEMIHYFILSQQLQDTSTHGLIFKRLMNEINVRHGRHVSISHRYTEDEHRQDTRQRQHIICISELTDGRTGITLAAHTRLSSLWRDVPRVPIVKQCRWYITSDPYFNRFPRSVKAKIYLADKEELERHLEGARALVKTDNTIHVKTVERP